MPDQLEHSLFPNRLVYLVGDSLGGCLALSVVARNPTVDLVLILSNPATSFGKSQLQPLLPILEALPNELHINVPYLLSFVMGDPVKMVTVNIEKGLSPAKTIDQLSENLTGLLPHLSWHKGYRWFEVNRQLGINIVEDVTFYPLFNEFCKPDCY